MAGPNTRWLEEEAEYIAHQRSTLDELTRQHRERLFMELDASGDNRSVVRKLLKIQKLTERDSDGN